VLVDTQEFEALAERVDGLERAMGDLHRIAQIMIEAGHAGEFERMTDRAQRDVEASAQRARRHLKAVE
jgi:hypothetical protein